MASSVPWAPVVAFMASSPLTSPQEYVWSVGLFGPAFATTFFGAAIAVGLIGGGAAWWLERHGLLAGQARLATPRPDGGCDTGCQTDAVAGAPVTMRVGGTRQLAVIDARPATVVDAKPATWRRFGVALATNGRRLAVYFLGFAALGYLVIRILPTGLLDHVARRGQPRLVGSPCRPARRPGLPQHRLLAAPGGHPPGRRHGPRSGHRVPHHRRGHQRRQAISGMLVIARWRIVALVIGTLLVTATIAGWLAGLWL